ncbi:MAG: hypothetical protein Q9215_005134, partial [Flavoplaca cf. flavocitrina]
MDETEFQKLLKKKFEALAEQIVLAGPARRQMAREEQTLREDLLLLNGQLFEQSKKKAVEVSGGAESDF